MVTLKSVNIVHVYICCPCFVNTDSET